MLFNGQIGVKILFSGQIGDDMEVFYQAERKNAPSSIGSEINSIFCKKSASNYAFLKKFGILNVTGGTPGLACAVSAGKKMVLDQKPPLQREQVVGSCIVNSTCSCMSPRSALQ